MFGKCAKNVNVIVTALDSQIRRKALKVGLRGPDTNSALCGWHGCFLTSKWTSDVSMYCFSFLFQNFWSFSGIFYGSGPLWESAIKVCDVASELLEVSVTQAHVPCTTPQLSLASSPVLPHVGLYPAVEGDHSLTSHAHLSVPCASGSFLKVPYWCSREKAHWWGLCTLALPSMLRHQEEV